MNDDIKNVIMDNRSFIYSIIHKFRGKDLEDLYQVGCLGLIRAYKSFNPSYNVKFTTYAYQYVLGEIYKYYNNNRAIRLSPENIRLLRSISKAINSLTSHLGRSPTDDEIAAFLEIDLYKLYEIRSMSIIESLDYQYENNNLYDFVSIDNVSKDELMDLSNALKSLSNEEKSLIKARYFDNYTQSDLAKIYHTNQVKISRDEKKILCKLKEKMK